MAQVILPHFGYIMLVVAAVMPAVAMMVGSSRLRVLPVWFRRATIPIGVVLVVVGGSVSGLVLLPLWVLVAALTIRRTSPKLTTE